MAIFQGDWYDSLAVVIVAVGVRGVLKLCDSVRAFSMLKDLLVPAVVGLLTPLVTTLLGLELCRSTTVFLSILLCNGRVTLMQRSCNGHATVV